MLTAQTEDRFWSKVDRCGADDCWLWLGARFIQGYGKLFVGRNSAGVSQFIKAHRLSWELANGSPVPDGLFVLHSCDNPPCVNPGHLRVGTALENNQDRALRGRNRRQNGGANSNAKLTEGQVRAIIAELQGAPRRSQTVIAAEFGIKQAQVSRIARRSTWAHLWDE